MFDSLISGQHRELEIPIAGNARSLCSLKIRLGDALKWLADQFTVSGNEAFKSYAEIKPQLRFGISATGLVIQLRRTGLNQPDAADDTDHPLNLDVETIKRMIALANDPSQPLGARARFADTVKREFELRRDEPELQNIAFNSAESFIT